MGAACCYDKNANVVGTGSTSWPGCCNDSGTNGTIAFSSMSVSSTDGQRDLSKMDTKPTVSLQEQAYQVSERVPAPMLQPAFAVNGASPELSHQQSDPLSEGGSSGVQNLWHPPALEITFVKEDNTRESFNFSRRPVGLDLYKMNPITVKRVIPLGAADKMGVQSGWTICAINSLDVTQITPLETLTLITQLASKLQEDI